MSVSVTVTYSVFKRKQIINIYANNENFLSFYFQVIFNKSINMCLDSFLKSSPRYVKTCIVMDNLHNKLKVELGKKNKIFCYS